MNPFERGINMSTREVKYKAVIILAGMLVASQAAALPHDIKARVQLAQEINKDQVVAVEGSQETSVYAHVAKKWIWDKSISYDLKFSASSSYRYDINKLANSNYKIAVGLDF